MSIGGAPVAPELPDAGGNEWSGMRTGGTGAAVWPPETGGTGGGPSWEFCPDVMRTTPVCPPTDTLAAVSSAKQLRARQQEAKERFVFIGGSDRSEKADCTGYSGTIGYSVRSEFMPLWVELKYDGCADGSECASRSGR